VSPRHAPGRLAALACSALWLAAASAQDRFPGPAPAAGPAPLAPAAPLSQAPPPPRAPDRPAERPAARSDERQDFGVPAPDRLHGGPMHGPTPNRIPGAQLVTTPALLDLLKPGPGQALVFDVLGSHERLPGALNAVPAHQAGSFDDAVQRDFGQFLQQVTQGQKDRALVFYCQSTMCWMSYNAALRASRLGYRQVHWYRGGVEAWKAAGQPLQGAAMPTR
jgi:PQQ-dependent catabolism-associated CXXCW motif protein